MLCLLTRLDLHTGEVNEHKVVVGAARNELEAFLLKLVSESCRILNYLLCVCLERGLESLAEANRLCSDGVHKRTSLDTGEDSLVDLLCDLLVVAKDKTATGASESLVSSGGGNVSVRNGRGMNACGNKTCDVRHIYHKVCANLLSDSRELLEIDDSGICRSTRKDKLRLALEGKTSYLLVVDNVLGLGNTVGNDVPVLTRHIYGRAVAEVSSVSKIHGKNCIAGLKKCIEHCHICLCAGVSLYVCIACAEELLCSLNGDGLNNVNVLATTVIALAGIALGILVGKGSAVSLHNRLGYEVLGRDKLDLISLSRSLVHYRGVDLRVICLKK